MPNAPTICRIDMESLVFFGFSACLGLISIPLILFRLFKTLIASMTVMALELSLGIFALGILPDSVVYTIGVFAFIAVTFYIEKSVRFLRNDNSDG